MLEEYVEVPRSASLLDLKYIPTPTRHRSTSQGESDGEPNEEDEEEFQFMLQELYSRKSRYELDIN